MAWNGAGQPASERFRPEQLVPEHRHAEPAVGDEGTEAAARTSTQDIHASRGALTVGQRARWTLGAMCGRSAATERLFLQMRYLSNHLRVASIEGEPGTGKRLTASTLHQLRGPAAGSFVSCPATRFFTDGASAERLAQASSGTLYLSAADALEPELQGNLLHLIGWVQQQAVGARGTLRLSQAAPEAGSVPRVLLVGFSRPLRPLMLYGKLRSDLYHQLAAVQLKLPPLRERREDIAMLTERFVLEFSERYGKSVSGLAEETLSRLLHYSWPGNVAELRQSVDRAALRAAHPWLSPRDFHLPQHPVQPGNDQQSDALQSAVAGGDPEPGRKGGGQDSVPGTRSASGRSADRAPTERPRDQQQPTFAGLVPWPEPERALAQAEPATMAASCRRYADDNGLKRPESRPQSRPQSRPDSGLESGPESGPDSGRDSDLESGSGGKFPNWLSSNAESANAGPTAGQKTGTSLRLAMRPARSAETAPDPRPDSRPESRPKDLPEERFLRHGKQSSFAPIRSAYPPRPRQPASFLQARVPSSPGAARRTPLPPGTAAVGPPWGSQQAADAQRTQQSGSGRPLELRRGAEGNAHPEPSREPDWNLDRAILRHIRLVLGSVNGNKLRAARLLGISRSTLYRLLESAVSHAQEPGGYPDQREKASSNGQ